MRKHETINYDFLNKEQQHRATLQRTFLSVIQANSKMPREAAPKKTSASPSPDVVQLMNLHKK